MADDLGEAHDGELVQSDENVHTLRRHSLSSKAEKGGGGPSLTKGPSHLGTVKVPGGLAGQDQDSRTA
jgi:hypothetical protein